MSDCLLLSAWLYGWRSQPRPIRRGAELFWHWWGCVDFDDVTGLVNHPAWQLLRADSAPLILTFCGTVFVDENGLSRQL
ncbi:MULTISPECIES: DUF3375 family protein [unclassified Streptomyces]|uniref:DUF3375 family protein n=1 Tax=unclassified Streptomyces TaxID=2593676 RepID=UPI001EFDC706|nr:MULTISPECIES: DUF3375 family protein [unclassified Streptomyces]